jgi:hypothetical protein
MTFYNRMTTAHKFIYILILLIIIASCKENPVVPPEEIPLPKKDTVTVILESLTHRSATLNIRNTAHNPERTIRVYRSLSQQEFTLIDSFPASVKDTLIIDDNFGAGLTFNTDYSWYAATVDTTGEIKDSSNKVTASTLDTTSHNYTWEEYTFGEWQSAFYDVWGTDENNVWVAGLVLYGNTYYGAFHYNGQEFTRDSTAGGYSIFGFAENDIWAAAGGVFHFNGSRWEDKTDLDSALAFSGGKISMWGTSSNDLYMGTNLGKIVHWNGTKGKVVLQDQDYWFYDIFGFSSSDIYAIASKFGKPVDKLYNYNGSSWQVVIESPPYLQKPLRSVWGVSSQDLYVVGRRIERRLNGVWSWTLQHSYSKIRGSASNNIVVIGSYGSILHYNGATWKDISPGVRYDLILNGVYVTENKIFCVGEDASYAKILIGTRN